MCARVYVNKCGRQFSLHPSPAVSLIHHNEIVCSCILISIVAHCATLPLLLPATCAFVAGNCSRGASKQQQTARQRESETDAGVDVAVAAFFLVVGVTKFYIYTRTLTHRHSRTHTRTHTHLFILYSLKMCTPRSYCSWNFIYLRLYFVFFLVLCLFLLYFALTFYYCCSCCCQCQFRCSPRCGVVASVAVVVSTHFALSLSLCVCVRDACSCSLPSLSSVALLVGGTCKPFRLLRIFVCFCCCCSTYSMLYRLIN